MKKTNNKRPSPVMIQGGSFQDMINDFKNQPLRKPLTKKEQAELNKLLKQLRDSQGPGDALIEIKF